MNKTFKDFERIVKGFSNHRRVEIIELLSKKPELSVAEISKNLKINFKTASEHIRRLAISGLIIKRSDGTFIRHKLTKRGEEVIKFLKELE